MRDEAAVSVRTLADNVYDLMRDRSGRELFSRVAPGLVEFGTIDFRKPDSELLAAIGHSDRITVGDVDDARAEGLCGELAQSEQK